LRARLAARDGEGAHRLAATRDAQAVLRDVDRRQLLPAYGHRAGDVAADPLVLAGLEARERRVEGHRRAGLPEGLRAPHELTVVEPPPRPLRARRGRHRD